MIALASLPLNRGLTVFPELRSLIELCLSQKVPSLPMETSDFRILGTEPSGHYVSLKAGKPARWGQEEANHTDARPLEKHHEDYSEAAFG